MKIVLTLDDTQNYPPDQVADIVDTGRRNPEDVKLMVKHDFLYIQALAVDTAD